MSSNLHRSVIIALALLILAGSPKAAEKQAPMSEPDVFSSGYYPCSDCHSGMEANPVKRSLSFHEEIRIKNHGEPTRWCLDCHDPSDRDSLRLSNGERISFSKSHLLCGQCHGNILRDWNAGVHGKRTGMWDAEKKYLLCTSCHNPHSPRFKPIKPERGPQPPAATLRK
jgi:uncharacterized CHY-type Zn-finger protein